MAHRHQIRSNYHIVEKESSEASAAILSMVLVMAKSACYLQIGREKKIQNNLLEVQSHFLWVVRNEGGMGQCEQLLFFI